jgi:hypothetical protein
LSAPQGNNRTRNIMTTEITNTIKMISDKVSDLVNQGMDQQLAFNAVMERLENEHPQVFAFLTGIAKA